MSVIEVAQTAGKINEHIEETGITRKDERRCNVPETTLRVALEQWNAPTEEVHLLG